MGRNEALDRHERQRDERDAERRRMEAVAQEALDAKVAEQAKELAAIRELAAAPAMLAGLAPVERMSRRDWFAAAALAKYAGECEPGLVGAESAKYADALIAALDAEDPTVRYVPTEPQPAAPVEPPDPVAGVKALTGKAWRWDLLDFARALGRPPEQCMAAFERFQGAAGLLTQLDKETLALLCSPTPAGND